MSKLEYCDILVMELSLCKNATTVRPTPLETAVFQIQKENHVSRGCTYGYSDDELLPHNELRPQPEQSVHPLYFELPHQLIIQLILHERQALS